MPATVFAQDKSGVKPSVISLPSGPGSLEGLGESFAPNLNTGTSSYPVNFTAVPGRIGFQPEISLTYNGGNANGPWGMGWELNIPSIQRRTEDGIPSYDDARDTFIHSAGEKLVRLANGGYRFENESAFMRFRRLTNGGWEAHTPDGVRYVFGETEAARVTNLMGIFRWELERVIDTNGNEMRYLYLHDGGYAYPLEIRYNFGTNQGGGTPYNTIIFSYEPRPDTFSDRRSGAPIRIGLRGSNIEMWALGRLVRAYAFAYEPERSTGTYSLLRSVTQVGDDGTSTLPPHTFTYTQFDPTAYTVVTMQNPPPVTLLNPDADLVSIRCNGLADILHTSESGEHRFYINLGNGRWDPQPVIPQNSPAERLSNPNVRMGDFDSNGCPDFLVKAGNTPGSPFYYYANRGDGEWQKEDRVDLGQAPAFDLNSPNIDFNDFDNDGDADVGLMSDERLKIWLARAGGWSQEADFDVAAPAAGGSVNFSDAGLFVMDMDGDSVTDLVMVRESRIVIWSHNGNGNYDEPTTLLNPPTGVGDGLLRMADLNNDGKGEPLLIGNRSITYWLNLGNGSLSAPITLQNTPAFNAQDTAIRLADINGDGADEAVFSSSRGMEYVDFSTGPQPFLLQSVDSGLGRTIQITYKSSIEDYIADQDAGTPWERDLPFPVQVVSRVTVHDANSGDDYTIDYHYRDGYYDGAQKEFRGFIRSQEIKVGDDTAATTITNLLYDVGIEDEARKGLLLESAVVGVGGECAGDFAGCYLRIINQLETRTLVDAGETASGQPIAYAFIKQTDSFIHEQTVDPIHLRQSFQQDDYGNQTEHFNYGQVCGGDVTCGDDELLTYTEFIYDEARYLLNQPMIVRQTDAAGNFVSETRLYYDGEDYVGLPLGQLTRGNVTRETQNLGPHGDNRVISTKRQAFDDYGNVVGMMDGNGNRITVEYDALAHTFPVLERLHLGGGRSLSYAATYHHGFGKPLSATDYNGHAHAFAYDTFGRLAKIAQPGDTLNKPTEQYRYEIGSPRSAIWTEKRERSGEDGLITSVAYFDGLGRKLQVRSEADSGQVVVTEAVTFNARQGIRDKFLPYFDTGYQYSAPDPTLPKATIHYDPRARTTRTVNPDGSFTRIVYGPLREAHYDEEDNKPGSSYQNTPKTLTFDGLDRLISVEEINLLNGEAERNLTRYAYDRLGNLTQIIDPQGNIKSMIYDALKRKLRMDDPDRGEVLYRYDDAGNLLMSRDAKGQEIHFTYDAANRPLSERWIFNNGQADVVNAIFHYDGDLSPRHPDAHNTLGQVAYIEDQAGSVFFSYDARGNLTGSIRHFAAEDLTLVSGMNYDALDRLVALTYPNGSTATYEYDARGLLQSIPGFIDNITYAASGLRDKIAYGNGVNTLYSYDARLRLTRLLTQGPQAVLQDLRLSLDDVGNVTSITDGRANRTSANDWTQSFRYDSLYRLLSATGTFGQIDYAYDRLDNVISKVSTAPDPRLNLGPMRYGEGGAGPRALTAVNGETWRYDATGNLLQKKLPQGDGSYTWDARNRLLTASEGDIHSTYLYDADLQRVKQTVRAGDKATTVLYAGEYAEVRGDELILYVFDDERRVAHVATKLDRSQLLTGFSDVTPAGQLTAGQPTAERRWTTADHLGGTNLLVDESGAVLAEMVYYPFGLTRYEKNGGEVRYGFTGKELDASGLHYFGARYYEPISGRFISADPLFAEKPEAGLKEPRHLNLYTYGLNNPIRMIDPDGKQSRYVIIAYGTGEDTGGTRQVAERLKRNVQKQLRKIDPKIQVKTMPANRVARFAAKGRKTVSAFVFVGHAATNRIAPTGMTADTTVYDAAKEARVAKGGAVIVMGCNAVNGRTESERELAKEGISTHGFSDFIGWDPNGSGKFTADPFADDLKLENPERVRTESRTGRETVATTLQEAVRDVKTRQK